MSGGPAANWRFPEAYGGLLVSDRRAFGWEWLRRSPLYRNLWENRERGSNEQLERLGLHGWIDPALSASEARPIWSVTRDPRVLRGRPAREDSPADDLFDVRDVAPFVSVEIDAENTEHWLLSDGHWAIRLDLHDGTLLGGPILVEHRISGLQSAKPIRIFGGLRYTDEKKSRYGIGGNWALTLGGADFACCFATRLGTEGFVPSGLNRPNFDVRDLDTPQERARFLIEGISAPGRRDTLIQQIQAIANGTNPLGTCLDRPDIDNGFVDCPADGAHTYGRKTVVDVWGGWKDAGGDNGKYLSHLSYANFFNPQQTGFAAWALAKSYDLAPATFRAQGTEDAVIAEALWGADFLHRLLAPEGYFYMTVFDRWGTPGAERVLTAYSGRDGVYSENYAAAFREGGGAAIAALARIARLSKAKGVKGAFTADQYLADAERAFAHLQANNLRYADDGKENIIDDYSALLAATELFESTGKPAYLDAARARAAALNGRLTDRGWFRSDDSDRPFYHGAEAGLPVIALVGYLAIEKDLARSIAAKATISRVLDAQLKLDASVANPFAYPRQTFQLYDFAGKKRDARIHEGFFMPHANETGYWWQGESARLASLSVAAVLGGRATAPQPGKTFGVAPELAAFAQAQIDWTFGRNPYDLSMVYGFGAKNPPHAESAGDMVRGGVSNGITGSDTSDEGRGITFAPGPDSENWRWIEQWIPHAAWLLLLASATVAEEPQARSSAPGR